MKLNTTNNFFLLMIERIVVDMYGIPKVKPLLIMEHGVFYYMYNILIYTNNNTLAKELDKLSQKENFVLTHISKDLLSVKNIDNHHIVLIDGQIDIDKEILENTIKTLNTENKKLSVLLIPNSLAVLPLVLKQGIDQYLSLAKSYTLEENVQQKDQEISVLKTEENILVKKVHDTTNLLLSVSHEIRNGLSPIQGFTEWAMIKIKEDYIPDLIVGKLKKVLLCTKALSTIVSDCMDYFQIEEGNIPYNEENFSVGQFIQELQEKCKVWGSEKNITFKFIIDSNLPQNISSDRTKLGQILTNIIQNAIKYTNPGKEISFRLDHLNGNLKFTISDEGQGIAAEKLDSIFLPFFQAHGSMSQRVGGIGLGLAITKNLVNILNGNISVQSSIGVGTQFIITIPCNDTPLNKENHSIKNEANIFPNKTILILEDDLVFQEVLKMYMDILNVNVVIFSKGHDGLNYLKENKPHLILTDLYLDDITGKEFVKEVLKNERMKNIPLIGFSVDSDLIREQKYSYLGFNEFLKKPIALDEIIKLFRKYL